MAKSILQYEKMVEDALRGVLRSALRQCENGLPGNHHFYITFRTRFQGVDIPEYVRARYPDEMTIVLQHQYWGLEVTEDWFEVTLSFNRVNERLHIPFAAVTAFADPSAQFGLQFQVDGSLESEPAVELTIEEDDIVAEPEKTEAASETEETTEKPAADQGAQVIALDAFRKK